MSFREWWTEWLDPFRNVLGAEVLVFALVAIVVLVWWLLAAIFGS